jgi:aspartyl-tRNA(Asn)/glutamyl-tRNA(Gln) amidotransferase subunit C
MEFDKKNLLKLGKLARISIKDDKLGSLGEDLNSILNFVDQLQEIKTDQVDPTSNSLDQKLISRDDIVEKINEAEDILANAPEQEMNFYVVPKVIE